MMKHNVKQPIKRWDSHRGQSIKADLVSALVVFFVAIPLCLGIALASGAPLLSGLISGIIGGIIVGLISDSHVSVSGPAAGLAAVVLASIMHLGDYNTFLLAVVLAGILQMLTGAFKAGFFAEYVPSNVIQGLLAAVGILLIIKQLPLAFTYTTSLKALKMHLLDATGSLSFRPLQDMSYHINTGAVFISACSFVILIFCEQTKSSWPKRIPGTIIVVFIGIILNEVFIQMKSPLAQTSLELVNIPEHRQLSDWIGQLSFPRWSAWTNTDVYLYATVLAIVASMESLLNIKASEKLDKKHRRTSKNRELLAQGIGNLCSGLIGGIPITSVIVRTSVNIQAGAHTKVSTILHGIYLLIAIILIPGLLNRIPLCSLAAVLIFTGYKLSSPKLIKAVYQQGLDRFIPFLVTLLGIVCLNLLTGIVIGLLTSLFFILRTNSMARLDIIKACYPNDMILKLILPQQTTFLNKASLIEELDAIPHGSKLTIDAQSTQFIDKEIIELIEDFRTEQASRKNITLNLIGFKPEYDIQNHINFINVTTYDEQAALSPTQVLNLLQEGNKRFITDKRIHRHLISDMQHAKKAQHPIAAVVACVDSTTPIETIFDVRYGDIFCIRNAGPHITQDTLASLEYAVEIMGVKLILIMGHTQCGVLQHAAKPSAPVKQYLPELEKKMARVITSSEAHHLSDLIHLHVVESAYDILKLSSTLQDLIQSQILGLITGVYDIHTGRVQFQDMMMSK